jgi:HEAT repeat protein
MGFEEQWLGKSMDTIEQLIVDLGHPDQMAREKAAAALTRVHDARAVGPLILALRDVSSWRVRADAAEALGAIGDQRACIALRAALHDGTADVTDNAMLALIALGERSVIPQLLQELHDPQEYLRWRAARGLGEIGDASILFSLEQRVRDRHEVSQRVVDAARRAAEQIRGRLTSQ